MQVAAIYDIHGNLPALEAVLRDVRDVAVDAIVVGGDVIPGPMPREAIELLAQLDRPTHFLVGSASARCSRSGPARRLLCRPDSRR